MATTAKRPAPSSGIDYSYDLDASDDDNGSTYVPLKKRREEQLKKLASRGGSHSRSATPGGGDAEEKVKEPEFTPEELEEREKARKRLERTLLAEAQDVHKQKAMEGECEPLLVVWCVVEYDCLSYFIYRYLLHHIAMLDVC